MHRYRFVLRPKWILGHIIVVVLAVTFISLGFWQLSRLHGRKAFNHLVERNEAAPTVPVETLNLQPRQGTGHAKNDQGRRVTVTGTYVANESKLIRGQSIDEDPGAWIVTPIRLADGNLVLVNRGFVRDNGTLNAAPAQTTPPTGTVTVTGSVQPTETPSVFEHRDPAGLQPAYQRIDVDRIRSGIGQPTLPLWVLATSQTPKDPGLALEAVPPPNLSNGPHLSYAIQWFSFTAVGLIGYPLLLAKKAADLERDPTDDEIIDLTRGDADGRDGEPAESDEELSSTS